VKKDSIGWHPSAAFFQLFLFHQAVVWESPLYTTDLLDTFGLLSLQWINWLKKLGYTGKDVKKGFYHDGHE